MKKLGFSQYEISLVNELRMSRNGINFYGKIFDITYAESFFELLIEINPKLDKLFE